MIDEDKAKRQLIKLERLRQKITELKESEAEHKKAEERARRISNYTRSLIEVNLDPLVTISPEGKITDVNEATVKVTGITREKLIGTNFSDYFTDPGKAEAGYQQVLREGSVQDYELEIQHVDGHITPVSYNASVYHDEVGELAGVFAAARDITERKKAEEAIKLAYRELDQIFQTAADGMRMVDKDFNMLRVNETFSNLVGIDKDEAVGKKCYDVFPGPLCHTPDCPLTRIMEGEERFEEEVEKERMDGKKIPCIVTATPFVGPDDELIGIVEDFKDITERKQAENVLKEREERLRMLTDNMLDVIGLCDIERNLRYISPSSRVVLGYEPEELLDKPCSEFVHPDDSKRVEANCEGVITAGSPARFEYRFRHKDGYYIWVERICNPLLNDEGQTKGAVFNIRDITERKQAEKELKQLVAELKR